MKHVRVLALSAVLLFIASPNLVLARSQVVISTQVRGKECCDSGSDGALDLQIATLLKLKLPASFALRFDALVDSHTLQALKESPFEKAAFLEITPSLASQSGVAYRGPVERWYKAGNAYLVGYDPSDRQKIIDVYMKKYKDVFGNYPQSTVAWMIDAWSLSYLHEKYGVTVHELTREQWGTDSYTLYGGPVNVPYYPSKNWPLIPSTDKSSALPVLTVRQTLTDPLYTYGDEQSSFTSQPNDYMFGQKDFSFFTGLLDNAMKATFPNGFAVLGLETSMTEIFQNEFVRQLEYVASLRDQKSIDVVSLHELPSLYPLPAQAGILSAYVSPSENSTKHAFWINTPHYRARFIADTNEVLLSDLRVYSEALNDPYIGTASASLNAYWTVPFLYDGSRYRSETTASLRTRIKDSLQSLKSEKRDSSDFRVTQNDFAGTATGLQFPKIKLDSSIQFTYSPLAVSLSYPSDRGKVSIQFLRDEFTVQLPSGDTVHDTLRDPLVKQMQSEKLLLLDETTAEDKTVYRPRLATSAGMVTLISKFPKVFSPESSAGEFDINSSAFIVANRRAIVGRNPIRLVIRLQDDHGSPTIARDKPTVLLTDTDVKITVHEPESAHGEYYIDLSSQKPTSTGVIVSFGSKSRSFGTVYFVPNCLTEKMICIKHPEYVLQFVWSKYDEFVRKIGVV